MSALAVCRREEALLGSFVEGREWRTGRSDACMRHLMLDSTRSASFECSSSQQCLKTGRSALDWLEGRSVAERMCPSNKSASTTAGSLWYFTSSASISFRISSHWLSTFLLPYYRFTSRLSISSRNTPSVLSSKPPGRSTCLSMNPCESLRWACWRRILRKETPQSLMLVPRGCAIQRRAFSTKPPILPALIPWATLTMSSSVGCVFSRPIWLVLAVIRPNKSNSPYVSSSAGSRLLMNSLSNCRMASCPAHSRLLRQKLSSSCNLFPQSTLPFLPSVRLYASTLGSSTLLGLRQTPSILTARSLRSLFLDVGS